VVSRHDLESRLEAYDFALPDSLIATRPLDERDASRLLALRRDDDTPRHLGFRDIETLLNAGDCLVLNDTRVIPARLFAHKAESGGRIEVLLSRREDDDVHVALLNPGRRLREGTRLVFEGDGQSFDPLFATVLGRVDDEPGAWRVRFFGDPYAYAIAYGQIPLPPYMRRDDDDADRERYQTVYAGEGKEGAAAAPTAGLHFTPELLARLEEKGVSLVKVTLHVGPGTFLPVKVEDVREHRMHAEPWELTAEAAAELNATRARGGRIIPVGTTALRVLESAADEGGVLREGRGLTRLFVRPGYRFRATDALITNFHLPRSTLLMLVSALVGRERLLSAYEEAVRLGYRFFSYGDACFFERRVLDPVPPDEGTS